MKLKTMLKIGYWGFSHHIPGLSGFMNKMIRKKYFCDIPTCMKIPATVEFKHNGLGCTINAGVILGENVIIHQNVVIGKRKENMGCPRIGNNVLIGAGAIILGEILIGNNAKIGAGAIVVEDVPPNCTVVSPKSCIFKGA